MTHEQVKRAVELNNSINRIDKILEQLNYRRKSQPCTFKINTGSYGNAEEFTIQNCKINDKIFTIIWNDLLLKKNSLKEELEKL